MPLKAARHLDHITTLPPQFPIDKPDKHGVTLLMHAARQGKADALRFLIHERGARVDLQGALRSNAVMEAAKGGHLLALQVLINAKADLQAQDQEGQNALNLAVHKGQEHAVAMLAWAGIALDVPMKDGESPLMYTLQNNAWIMSNQRIHALALTLVRAGANLAPATSTNSTPLGFALSQPAGLMSEELVKTMIDKGVSVLRELASAARMGNSPGLRLLLDLGVDPNLKDAKGQTALDHACAAGALSSVATLIERGADVNTKDADNTTPLIQAVARGHVDVAHRLVLAGAEVDWADNDGHTAKGLAAHHPQMLAVLSLASAGPRTT